MERRRRLTLLLTVAFLVVFTASGIAQEGTEKTVTKFAPLPAATKATLEAINALNKQIRHVLSQIAAHGGEHIFDRATLPGLVLGLYSSLREVMATFPNVLGRPMSSWMYNFAEIDRNINEAGDARVLSSGKDWLKAIGYLQSAKQRTEDIKASLSSQRGGVGVPEANALYEELLSLQRVCVPIGKVDINEIIAALHGASTALDTLVGKLPNVWNRSLKSWYHDFRSLYSSINLAVRAASEADQKALVVFLTHAEQGKLALKRAVLQVR